MHQFELSQNCLWIFRILLKKYNYILAMIKGDQQVQKPEQQSIPSNKVVQNSSHQYQKMKDQSEDSNPQIKSEQRIKNSDHEIDEDQFKYLMQKEEKIADVEGLNHFINSKIKISKIVDSKSRIKEVNQQLEFQMIPCPYCAKQLTLSELDHIESCRHSFQCKFCKQTYPKTLLEDHLIVCTQRFRNQIKSNKSSVNIQHNRQLSQCRFCKEAYPKEFLGDHYIVCDKKWKNQIKPSRPYLDIPNQLPSKNKKINIVQKKPRVSRRSRQWIKQDVGEFGNYDQYQMDRESRIHARANKGFDKRQIDALETTIYFKQRDNMERQCSVCMNLLQSGDIIMKLSCHHFFHQECLRPWLAMKTQCPTCKAQIQI